MENYEFIQIIGKGNFGCISKIKRKSDNEILVWKEIDYGKMSEKEKSQIVSEVNILRELKHDNIVKYYDRIIDKKNTKIYIVMEYCEGGDIGQLIKKCKKNKEFLAEDVIWKIFTQIVLALYECHSNICESSKNKCIANEIIDNTSTTTIDNFNKKKNKILHRDLKPNNVFLDANNNVKLGDFGLARILSNESKFAQSHVGTPYYMSPEQIEEKDYDEKSDIWSLGCFLFELTTLNPPFEAKNHYSLAIKIKSGKVERISSRYSEELQRVILWLMQVDLNRRPSVEDLLNLPHVSLRLREKRLKENVNKLKIYEESLKLKKLKLFKKENELKAKEEAIMSKLTSLEKKQNDIMLAIDQYSKLKQDNNIINNSIQKNLFKKTNNTYSSTGSENINLINYKDNIDSKNIIPSNINKNFISFSNYNNDKNNNYNGPTNFDIIDSNKILSSSSSCQKSYSNSKFSNGYNSQSAINSQTNVLNNSSSIKNYKKNIETQVNTINVNNNNNIKYNESKLNNTSTNICTSKISETYNNYSHLISENNLDTKINYKDKLYTNYNINNNNDHSLFSNNSIDQFESTDEKQFGKINNNKNNEIKKYTYNYKNINYNSNKSIEKCDKYFDKRNIIYYSENQNYLEDFYNNNKELYNITDVNYKYNSREANYNDTKNTNDNNDNNLINSDINLKENKIFNECNSKLINCEKDLSNNEKFLSKNNNEYVNNKLTLNKNMHSKYNLNNNNTTKISSNNNKKLLTKVFNNELKNKNKIYNQKIIDDRELSQIKNIENISKCNKLTKNKINKSLTYSSKKIYNKSNTKLTNNINFNSNRANIFKRSNAKINKNLYDNLASLSKNLKKNQNSNKLRKQSSNSFYNINNLQTTPTSNLYAITYISDDKINTNNNNKYLSKNSYINIDEKKNNKIINHKQINKRYFVSNTNTSLNDNKSQNINSMNRSKKLLNNERKNIKTSRSITITNKNSNYLKSKLNVNSSKILKSIIEKGTTSNDTRNYYNKINKNFCTIKPLTPNQINKNILNNENIFKDNNILTSPRSIPALQPILEKDLKYNKYLIDNNTSINLSKKNEIFINCNNNKQYNDITVSTKVDDRKLLINNHNNLSIQHNVNNKLQLNAESYKDRFSNRYNSNTILINKNNMLNQYNKIINSNNINSEKDKDKVKTNNSQNLVNLEKNYFIDDYIKEKDLVKKYSDKNVDTKFDLLRNNNINILSLKTSIKENYNLNNTSLNNNSISDHRECNIIKNFKYNNIHNFNNYLNCNL